MKKLIFVFAVLVLFGCVSKPAIIHENVISDEEEQILQHIEAWHEFEKVLYQEALKAKKEADVQRKTSISYSEKYRYWEYTIDETNLAMLKLLYETVDVWTTSEMNIYIHLTDSLLTLSRLTLLNGAFYYHMRNYGDPDKYPVNYPLGYGWKTPNEWYSYIVIALPHIESRFVTIYFNLDEL